MSSVIEGSLSKKNTIEGTLSMSSRGSSVDSDVSRTPGRPTSISGFPRSSLGGRSLTTWQDFDESSDLTSLNSNLEKYIELVKNLEKQHVGGLKSTGETVINVNIDRRKIQEIQTKYTNELSAIQGDCSKNAKKIADLLAEIFRLKSQIKILTNSNSNKQATVGDLDLTIGQLDAEIARLKASLGFHQGQKVIFEAQLKALEEEVAGLNARLESTIKKLNDTTVTNADLAAQINLLEKELRFKVSVKSRELLAERSKSYINWEEIKNKKGEKYRIWMEGELERLQDTYKAEMETVQETWKAHWEDKKRDLKADLEKAEKAAGVEDEEARKLKIELEELRLRVGELEASKQHLSVKQMEIKAELEVKRNAFNAQKSAKEKELEKMRTDCEAIKNKYDQMMKGINWEQVALYSTTLTPEIRRISGRFGTQQVVSSGRKLNFSRNTVSSTKSSKSSSSSVNGV